MKFDLTKPCPDCPFRTDCLEGWLGERRAEEISDALLSDATFTCHNTNEFDDDGQVIESRDSQHCAGALIFLEHQERPNQMMRWMERIGVYDRRKLDMTAPVFDDPEAFICHHAGEL